LEAHNYGQRQIEEIKNNNEIEKGRVIVCEKSLGEMRAWRPVWYIKDPSCFPSLRGYG